MTSLATRLTLAFLLVGILGIGLVTTLNALTTRSEFDRFIERRTLLNDDRHGDRFPSRTDDEHLFLANVLRISLRSSVITAIVALGAGALLSRGLTRPIRALTEATQRIAAGELGTQVDVANRRDEIGRLAHSFNKMSSDIAEATRKREQMTADIAHDLRTPLTILRGYMEGIRDGTIENSAETTHIMFEEVAHLEHLIDDLRTLSLADAGELSLNAQSIHPRSLLERTGLAYIVQAERKGIALRIDADEQLDEMSVDVERMTQVLNNLVANALRYTDEGEIILGAFATVKGTMLSVRDTGSGIAADALPHIFDRFYRADPSRNRSSGGSGLGLAIAQAIVQAHGGTITVESASENGTLFEITLPEKLTRDYASGNVSVKVLP